MKQAVDYDDEQDAQGETDEEYDPILSIEDMPPVSATVQTKSGRAVKPPDRYQLMPFDESRNTLGPFIYGPEWDTPFAPKTHKRSKKTTQRSTSERQDNAGVEKIAIESNSQSRDRSVHWAKPFDNAIEDPADNEASGSRKRLRHTSKSNSDVSIDSRPRPNTNAADGISKERLENRGGFMRLNYGQSNIRADLAELIAQFDTLATTSATRHSEILEANAKALASHREVLASNEKVLESNAKVLSENQKVLAAINESTVKLVAVTRMSQLPNPTAATTVRTEDPRWLRAMACDLGDLYVPAPGSRGALGHTPTR